MTETSDGEAPALQTLGLLICTVEQGAELLQTDKQRGRVIAHSWTRRPISLITAGAGSAEEQLWELGGEKASETFSAHSVSTLTWTQGRLCLPSESHLELRHLGPCHAHSHAHGMNSLKTPFAPRAAEALMSAHLISRYRLPS